MGVESVPPVGRPINLVIAGGGGRCEEQAKTSAFGCLKSVVVVAVASGCPGAASEGVGGLCSVRPGKPDNSTQLCSIADSPLPCSTPVSALASTVARCFVDFFRALESPSLVEGVPLRNGKPASGPAPVSALDSTACSGTTPSSLLEEKVALLDKRSSGGLVEKRAASPLSGEWE